MAFQWERTLGPTEGCELMVHMCDSPANTIKEGSVVFSHALKKRSLSQDRPILL
jgi:hypothetical protein